MPQRLLLLFVAAVVPFIDVLLAQPPARAPRKVAFLVGVGTYDFAFSDLGKAPENDVIELGKEFAAGGFEVVTLLGSATGTDRATKANIEARYKQLVDGATPLTNRDTLVVVLCGHGLQAAEPLFCPVDARRDKPAETMVRLNGLLDATKELGETCLFLVDACRDDPNRGVKRDGIQGKKADLSKKTAVLFSCSNGESAYQDRKAGHGVFTFAVLKTIRDGGGANWGRLSVGVQEAFQTDEIKAMLPAGETQTPVEVRGELGFTELLVKLPEPGEVRKFEVAAGVFMEFCWIPPGKATLGSPKSERSRAKYEDEHEFVSKGFWLGRYEVTQDEWAAVTKTNPSYFDGANDNLATRMKTGRFPVENVGWDDISKADGFLARVNARPGAKSAFGKAGKFCLPHEDEWEYAARGGRGNQRPFFWGTELDGSQANCDSRHPYNVEAGGKPLGRTCAVDDPALRYPKHPWNLAHLNGNVWEWCENKPFASMSAYVLRGGSWDNVASYSRAASRTWHQLDTRRNFNGFRLCFRHD